MAHWTETFFTDYWSLMQRSKPLVDAAAEEARVLGRVLRLRKGNRILDVPCGDGRISIGFARAGCRVVGVDACGPSVSRARARFRRAGLPGEFHLGDMRDLRVPGGFDAVVNWWGSFGYFDDDTNLEVLRGFAEVLRPGGRVLIDQVNRERILRDFRRRAVSEDGGVRVTISNRWDPAGQRVNGTWTFVRLRGGSGGGSAGPRLRKSARLTSSIRLYTPRQMKALMEAAGLELERFCDGTTGLPFDRGSRRMTSVGRKP